MSSNTRSRWSAAGGNAAFLAAVNVADEKPPFVDGGTAVSDSLRDPYDVANATAIGPTLALMLSKRR